ncbi:MAG: threonylcarbamoyl-AMP synthase [Myxococcales bacterium]|nr:threonylcarbamoyl-AMP synthase [Myxococcales bacterium]
MRIEINPEHPEPRKIARAVEALRRGECIAYPTDTVYGLGCAMTEKRAVDQLYDMKRMKREQALALLVPDLSGIARFAVVQDSHYRFIKHLVPGPYVFILEATREVPKLLMMKRKTIGIRVPEHPVAAALARELGEPIISTTASHPNDGPEALQDPDDIDARFPQLAMVLDAGFGEIHPSTVIDLTGAEPVVSRAGAGIERLEKLYGLKVRDP